MAFFRTGQPIAVQHAKPWKTGGPIQMRGTVGGFDGVRLLVNRRFRSPGRLYDGLAAVQHPGDHGTIELRLEAWVSRRRYLRANDDLIGELFNIQTPTQYQPGIARYVDLEVDVAFLPHLAERVALQDLKDLEEGVAAGYIPAEMAAVARGIAQELAGRLKGWNGRDELEWDVRPDPAASAGALRDLAHRWPGFVKAA